MLRSSIPVPFFELSTVMDVKITNDGGETVCHKAGPLDGHYQRMVKEGETSWPAETEWMAEYEWDDDSIDGRAVGFEVGKTPRFQTTCELWSPGEASIDRGEHVLAVRISAVEKGYKAVTAEINCSRAGNELMR